MKTAILKLLLLGLLMNSARSENDRTSETSSRTLHSEFTAKLEALKLDYQIKIAAELEKSDRVEIYHLGKGPELRKSGLSHVEGDPFTSGEEWFPIPIQEVSCKITKKVSLTPEKKKVFSAKFREILIHESNENRGCYDPHHGVRFFKGDEIILEADICIKCYGLCLHYPDHFMFRQISLTSNSIQSMLLEAIPLSDEELGK